MTSNQTTRNKNLKKSRGYHDRHASRRVAVKLTRVRSEYLDIQVGCDLHDDANTFIIFDIDPL